MHDRRDVSVRTVAKKGRRRGGRLRPDRDGKHVELLARSARMEGVLVTLWPATDFGRVYAHEGEEIRMVLEGEVEMDVGGRRYRLKKGDVLWHNSEVPHSLRNPSRKRARYFVVMAPPSRM